MKLHYGTAVVSFCPDLTAADGQSVPLAALLVGETEEGPVAALTWRHALPPLVGDDPVASAMLQDLPKLLRDHVNQAWEHIDSSSVDIDAVLIRLRDALRNSLHVSHVRQDLVAELSDVDEEFAKGLFSLIGEALRLTGQVSARTSIPAPTPKPRRRNREFLMWEPSQATA